MGVLSVLNDLKSKTTLLASLLLTSIVLGSSHPTLADQSIIGDPSESNNAGVEQLPFCGNVGSTKNDRRLIYVTTLDGKLSALDISNNGDLKWTINTGPGSLLSSSIHQLELTNNGQWVRMIPSLSGGLYQFDGESIEPIPITAANLLDSSFKFSDDLVISGGKETRSYGVSSRTGQLLYECSMHGCKNMTDPTDDKDQFNSDTESRQEEVHNPTVDDVIVVRRQTQTVRAVEPRTGHERWNFSVGHHDLDMLVSDNCHDNLVLEPSLNDVDLKIVVPEGLVCAVSKSNPKMVMWSHKFDFPIVSAWQTGDDGKSLKTVDLFASATSDWFMDTPGQTIKEGMVSPSIYVGMFNKQLYVQESELMSKLIHNDKVKHHGASIKYPQIPWRPFPATKSGLIALTGDDDVENPERALAILSDRELALTESDTEMALRQSVLYETGYVNGNGFFLYTADDLNKTVNGLCDSETATPSDTLTDDVNFTFTDNDTPVRIVIVSLWFWWKEIMVIAITTALLVNMLLSQRVRQREVIVVERHVEIPVQKDSTSVELSSRGSQRSLSESNNGDNFKSRFLSDFDMVRCLGKGGFGVVFEVKNKLDDCNYAIKRIVLPNKQESRDRVMREVKTLANCEHQNIVRYFQAWVETPPSGWQEQQDKMLFERDVLSTSIDIGTPTSDTHPASSMSSYPVPQKNTDFHVNNEVMNRKKLDSWITHLNTNECLNFDDEIRRTKISFNNNMTDDDTSSFIQFRNDDNEELSSVFDPSHGDNHDNDSFQIEFADSNGVVEEEVVMTKENDEVSHSKVVTITTTQSELWTNESEKKIVPFRKTHRRPLSLDLTSKGKVASLPPPATKMYLYIQMQLCRKQSLRDWLRHNDRAQREPQILSIFEQIVCAVEYVHMKGLIHRDLKPSNIFFSLDGQIRIGDFGLVTDMSDIPNIVTPCGDETGLPSCAKHTEQVGTHLYMSPEQLQGRPYNYKVDIFSLGLIFFELLIVFTTEMERIMTMKQLRNNQFPVDFQESFGAEFELLKLMLSQYPNERPTTFGIRSRPPLQQEAINTEWHFELPPRRHNSRTGSISISSTSSMS